MTHRNYLRKIGLGFSLLAALNLSGSSAHAMIFHGEDSDSGHELSYFLSSLDTPVEFQFCTECPDRSDTTIQLAVPAAFTTKAGTIDGLAILDGKNVGGALNPHLTGTAIFIKGGYEIVPTSWMTPKLIADLQKDGGSAFQQFLLVSDHKAQTFKDTKTARRRALVVFRRGDRSVVQSKAALTMGQFAQDLQKFGVRDALYMPIADADGGWYREDEKVIDIGVKPSGKPIQSNWIAWKQVEKEENVMAADDWLRAHVSIEPKPNDPQLWQKAVYYGKFPLPQLSGEGYDVVAFWNGSCKKDGANPSVDKLAIGPIDGQPGAVSFVTWSTGGTGVWEVLTLYRMRKGKIEPVGQYNLEDRAVLNSLRIANGTVLVDCVLHGPNDSARGPTLHKVLKLHAKNFDPIK